jgi:hypothetical protein
MYMYVDFYISAVSRMDVVNSQDTWDPVVKTRHPTLIMFVTGILVQPP